ncbi:MAG: hypothetical protein V4469_04495 [Patescibacteria group bacterium]
MNYEIALKLKEAGFPIKQWNCRMNEHWHDTQYRPCSHCEPIIPTLSELIEACGDKFCSLTYCNGYKYASSYSDDGFENPYICNGETGEEAVANLWIELNKI